MFIHSVMYFENRTRMINQLPTYNVFIVSISNVALRYTATCPLYNTSHNIITIAQLISINCLPYYLIN